MKKTIFAFIIAIVTFLSSCAVQVNTTVPSEPKGHIVVTNYCTEDVQITEIYVKSEHSDGYDKIFDGKILSNANHCIEVPPASYSVRITAYYPSTVVAGGVVGLTKQFETGYNIYKEAKAGGYLYVDFDGEGICFR